VEFKLTESQRILRQAVGRFAAREIRPHAGPWDEEARFPQERVPRLASRGLWGMTVPERYGGRGLHLVGQALVIEQLAWADGSVAHIAWCGNEAQKARSLGGCGDIRDCSVERDDRDVKLCEMGEGTSEIQRLIIAKETIGGSS
jgi:alkylation response protein AidB-like acyl-CoA dehydrogenase